MILCLRIFLYSFVLFHNKHFEYEQREGKKSKHNFADVHQRRKMSTQAKNVKLSCGTRDENANANQEKRFPKPIWIACKHHFSITCFYTRVVLISSFAPLHRFVVLCMCVRMLFSIVTAHFILLFHILTSTVQMIYLNVFEYVT